MIQLNFRYFCIGFALIMAWQLVGHTIWIYHLHLMSKCKFLLCDILKLVTLLDANAEAESNPVLEKEVGHFRGIFDECIQKTKGIDQLLTPSARQFCRYHFLWPNMVFSYSTPPAAVKNLRYFRSKLLDKCIERMIPNLDK